MKPLRDLVLLKALPQVRTLAIILDANGDQQTLERPEVQAYDYTRDTCSEVVAFGPQVDDLAVGDRVAHSPFETIMAEPLGDGFRFIPRGNIQLVYDVQEVKTHG